MKKMLYFVSCLLLGMTLSLSGCGEDDPTPVPEPENPTPDPEPEEPETVTLTAYQFQLNYIPSTGILPAGDSASYFALVEEHITAMRDSVESAKGSLVIEQRGGDHVYCVYDTNNTDGAAKRAAESLSYYLRDAGLQPRGFVYTGGVYRQTGTLSYTASGSAAEASFVADASGMGLPFAIYFPNLRQSVWTTADTAAAVQSIAFGESLSTTHVNDDAATDYSAKHQGTDVVLSLSGTEKYAFQLNTTGTELTLVRVDGEAMENGPVYTSPIFSAESEK